MFEFNNNNLFTGYIKEFLHEFNLPKAKVLRFGMTLFAGGYYVDANFIYKATINSVFGVDFTSVDDTYIDDFTGESVPYLYKIDNYVYGRKYLNITKNLELNSSIYNTYTHSYLGDYLRFYRDYKHIDLMSMYNCFSGEVGKNISISKTGEYDFDSSDENYVIYLVPVKFYQDYTIAVDCDLPVEIMACIYDNGRVCLQSEEYSGLYANTYFKTAGTMFNKPFKYTKLKSILEDAQFSKKSEIYSQEKNLKLMIKLPVKNKSSIVVLEGDYLSSAQQALNVRGFSWSAVGGYLDAGLDWFERDTTTGRFVKVLDKNTYYYDVQGHVVTKYEVGHYYYTSRSAVVQNYTEQDEHMGDVFLDGVVEKCYYLVDNPIYLDPDGVYYSFADSHLVTNFEVNNNERNISYYLNDSFLNSSPKTKDVNNIFVNEQNGKAYLWNIESGEYEQLNSETKILPIYSRKYNSRLQLLFVNDGNNHPFANKLVGYLLDNVISSDDKLSDNIRRLQKTFYYRKNPASKPDYNPKVDKVQEIGLDVFPKHAGLWSQDLRDMSYDLLNLKNNTLSSSFDSIGFVDKDVEKLLGDDISYDKTGHSISGGVR